MNLRPFLLLSPLLLGACEKKQTAPGSHPPDIATTKSTLRETDRKPRDHSTKLLGQEHAIQAIDRLIHSRKEDNREAIVHEVGTIISRTDPAAFDAIWKKLGEPGIIYRHDLQAKAIYHLAARGDLVAAGRIIRESAEYTDEHRKDLLWLAFHEGKESIVQALQFLREIGAEQERERISEVFPEHRCTLEGVSQLKEAGYRLNLQETRMIVDRLANTAESVANGPTEGSPRVSTGVMETVISLEQDGFFAKGALDFYLISIGKNGRSGSEDFQTLVPREKWQELLRTEGYEEVIESLIIDQVGNEDYPHLFFTPTGTHHLPPERINVALEAWHFRSPDGAEKWFAANAVTIPASQQDEIRVRFARNFWENQRITDTRRWLDQISDPALREQTRISLPKRGRFTSETLAD